MKTQGSYFDEEFSYIRVRILGCTNFNCADEDAIARKKSLKIYLPLSNISYDVNETSEALSWTLDNFRILPIKP